VLKRGGRGRVIKRRTKGLRRRKKSRYKKKKNKTHTNSIEEKRKGENYVVLKRGRRCKESQRIKSQDIWKERVSHGEEGRRGRGLLSESGRRKKRLIKKKKRGEGGGSVENKQGVGGSETSPPRSTKGKKYKSCMD